MALLGTCVSEINPMILAASKFAASRLIIVCSLVILGLTPKWEAALVVRMVAVSIKILHSVKF
jgi:uncharacterized membrane protein YphA (DoxX/SURF4 family)